MACCASLKRSRMDIDLHSPLLEAKRRRLPFTSKRSPSNTNLPMALQQQNQKLIFEKSPFADASIPQVTSDKIATSIREEMKRFQRRRQLNFENDNAAGSSSPSAVFGMTSPFGLPASDSGSATPPGDKPLFTFDQVGKICERMLTEREKELRATYENILVTKLDEQYDTFVKFTQEQLRAQIQPKSDSAFGEPSYLS